MGRCNCRSALRPVCLDILRSGTADEVVLENALRVLVLLQDDALIDATRRYRGQRSRLGNLAAILPVLAQASTSDSSECEARLFDVTRDTNDRIADFVVLSALTDDPGALQRRLTAADPGQAAVWNFFALLQSIGRPSVDTLPLLEAELVKAGAEALNLFVPLVAKLGELAGQQCTEMLLRCLSHPSPRVRVAATSALQIRRSKQASAPLSKMLEAETDTFAGQGALIALVASGPTVADTSAAFWSRSLDTELWRLVVAGRLNNAADAGMLVAVAVDPARHWQLRRAAIVAASRLPFADALAKIEGPVLKERTPFQLDKSHDLLGHTALVELLELEPDDEHTALYREAGVGAVWEIWFDAIVERALFAVGVPDAHTSVSWALSQLTRNGPPTPKDLNGLISELHIPILHAAVLRGLRMAGQYARIEGILQATDSEWLLVRGCCEYGNGRTLTPALTARLSARIAGSRFASSPFAANVVKSLVRNAARSSASLSHAPPPVARVLGVEEVLTAVRT